MNKPEFRNTKVTKSEEHVSDVYFAFEGQSLHNLSIKICYLNGKYDTHKYIRRNYEDVDTTIPNKARIILDCEVLRLVELYETAFQTF